MAGSHVIRKSYSAEVRQQLPFAIAVALTRTAQAAQRAVEQRIPQAFDRPTPFTQKSIAIRPARKGPKPEAWVFVKNVQAGYLLRQEIGGTITPQPGQPITVPIVAKDQYGNVPRGFWRRLRQAQVQRPYVPSSAFSVKTRKRVGSYGGGIFVVGEGQRLPPGVYERPKVKRGKGVAGKLKLLVALEKRATYERRFGFADTVSRTVATQYAETFRQALAGALKTAK